MTEVELDSPSATTTTTSIKSSCQECRQTMAIYNCPGCHERTCSLQCCQAHKQRTGCTGKRPRTDFLPLCRMSDTTLRSDYFFLEDVLSNLPSKKAKSNETVTSGQQHTKNYKRLQTQAQHRGITLQLMPTFMARHQANNSYYNGKQDVIVWKVDVVIYPEQETISMTILETESNLLQRILETETTTLDDTFSLFLQQIPSSAKSPRYIAVEEQCLKDALRGQTVIEYPTLYCVPPQLRQEFSTTGNKIVELVDGDAETNQTEQPGT